jgi:hypothetical protein
MRVFAEKLEFLNARAVKICTKTRILSSQASENLLFHYRDAEKLPQERKILTVQADICKIIGLAWRKLWFIGA